MNLDELVERLRIWADCDLDYSTTRSSFDDVHAAADAIERCLKEHGDGPR